MWLLRWTARPRAIRSLSTVLREVKGLKGEVRWRDESAARYLDSRGPGLGQWYLANKARIKAQARTKPTAFGDPKYRPVLSPDDAEHPFPFPFDLPSSQSDETDQPSPTVDADAPPPRVRSVVVRCSRGRTQRTSPRTGCARTATPTQEDEGGGAGRRNRRHIRSGGRPGQVLLLQDRAPRNSAAEWNRARGGQGCDLLFPYRLHEKGQRMGRSSRCPVPDISTATTPLNSNVVSQVFTG